MHRRLLISLALVLAHAWPAAAQGTDSPWSRGVTDDQKKTAQQLLEKGNQLMLSSRFKEAVPIYEEALASWNHPAIRFNLVKALIGLDKVLEAADHLDKALAYGAAPLEEQVYGEALTYQRLLKKQIATIVVRCDQAGVSTGLDGKTAVACPGSREMRVLPGEHTVVGAGPGYLTRVQDVTVLGGTSTTIDVHLREPGDPVRRWTVWKPWAVVGGGAALTATGIVFNVLARNRRDELHARTTSQCSVRGCDEARYEDLGLRALEDRVNRYNTISLVALGIGGAGLIAGGVLVVLNRVTPEAARVAVQPDATGVTLVVGGSF